MGYQIIKQPGTEFFGIFCSNTDTFVMWEATHADVVDYFVEMAAQRAREDAERVLGYVEAGNPRMAYAQFAKTWEQAVAMDREHGGEMSANLATETGQQP